MAICYIVTRAARFTTGHVTRCNGENTLAFWFRNRAMALTDIGGGLKTGKQSTHASQWLRLRASDPLNVGIIPVFLSLPLGPCYARTHTQRERLTLLASWCLSALARTHTHTHIPSYSVSFSLSLSLSHLLAPHLSPIMWKETCLRAFKKRNGYSGGWGQVSFFKESSSLSSEIFSRCGQIFSLQFVVPELLQQQQQPDIRT